MLSSLNNQKGIVYLINKYSNFISRVEAESLLSYIFKCTRTGLYMNNIVVNGEIKNLCESFIRRRLSGEPLQYITGCSEFMGLDFVVNKDVFIPRPETELLVNEILQITNDERRTTNDDLRILDLCTGCGNIAISLARFIPQAEIIATDISEPALRVARENSILHGADKNITFYKGDFFQALPFNKKYKFDIIVCNPPYVKSSELKFLQKEVRREPKITLDGGFDGLDFYRRIAGEAPSFLKPGGSLFLEIGFGQAKDIKDIFRSKNLFEIYKTKKDFAEIDRVLWINLL